MSSEGPDAREITPDQYNAQHVRECIKQILRNRCGVRWLRLRSNTPMEIYSPWVPSVTLYLDP
jgi:hypothetical protein